ncbi:glycosyl hydrolase 108 family protein [Microcoleus sp. FACHB-68]|uniref:glycoside hydrolase family 108 protein n=1 Tax=Microcoleus sp. FACHB-68 TaxID=2692826 RepID=UPI00168A3593|nr:glycosyl hydrolase 108 family protein [Microcoleus sp. FACHB-68]MBD1939083.1 hypothetical protein [Microcoleus sp. FACHB-68]
MNFREWAGRKSQPVLALNLVLGLFAGSLSVPLLPADCWAQAQSVAAFDSASFQAALRFTLYFEGGYSNHSADVGGKTYRGILQPEYDAYRAGKGLPVQDVRRMDNSELWEIYYSYWDASRAESMSPILGVAMFDTAVNFGRSGAVRFLQQALAVPVTGSFNSETFQALQSQNQEEIAKRMIENRIQYRYKRVRESPSQQVFLQGWLNRDYSLWSYLQWYQQQSR